MSAAGAMRLGVLLAAASLAGASLARAEDPPAEPRAARLEYVVAPGCPDEHFFRIAAASHLGGRDPFTPTAGRTVELEVSRTKGGYLSALAFYEDGRFAGKMDPIDDPDCTQVVEAAALAVLPFVRPLVRPSKPPPPEPAEAPAPDAAPPAPKPPDAPTAAELPPPEVPPPSPPAPKLPIVWRAGVLGRVDWRTQTAPAFGLTVDAGFKLPLFSLAAQFHAVPSAAAVAPASSALYAGGLVACVRADGQISALALVFALCGLGEVGEIQNAGTGNYGATPNKNPFGGGGGRVEVEFPIGRRVYIRAAGDFLGLAGPRFLYPHVVPAVGAGAGVGFAF
jgi:hypothetical protein